jgi:hypothetical protein
VDNFSKACTINDLECRKIDSVERDSCVWKSRKIRWLVTRTVPFGTFGYTHTLCLIWWVFSVMPCDHADVEVFETLGSIDTGRLDPLLQRL